MRSLWHSVGLPDKKKSHKITDNFIICPLTWISKNYNKHLIYIRPYLPLPQSFVAASSVSLRGGSDYHQGIQYCCNLSIGSVSLLVALGHRFDCVGDVKMQPQIEQEGKPPCGPFSKLKLPAKLQKESLCKKWLLKQLLLSLTGCDTVRSLSFMECSYVQKAIGKQFSVLCRVLINIWQVGTNLNFNWNKFPCSVSLHYSEHNKTFICQAKTWESFSPAYNYNII